MKRHKDSNSDKKVSLSQQAFLFSTLCDLLSAGLSVKQSLEFIEVVMPKQRELISKTILGLEAGKSLPDSMKFFLSDSVYQQLKIANEHGNLINGLDEIGAFIKLRIKQVEKIRGVIIYPIFLFIVLFAIILTLKFFISPETASLSGTTKTEGGNPWWWIALGISFAAILVLYCVYIYRQKSFLQQINFLTRLPLVGKLFADYYQYFIALNLSLMIKNGLDIKQIIATFLNFDEATILYELGKALKEGLNQGKNLNEILHHFKFLSNEMVIFLSNGSTSEQLSENLNALSQLSFKKMINRSNLIIKMIQPISFVIIGMTIVLTYLQMLLPMYNSMKGIY